MATKEEIAQNEQFLLLSPCFQLYSIIVLLYKGNSQMFSSTFSTSSAADLLNAGDRVKQPVCLMFCNNYPFTSSDISKRGPMFDSEYHGVNKAQRTRLKLSKIDSDVVVNIPKTVILSRYLV